MLPGVAPHDAPWPLLSSPVRTGHRERRFPASVVTSSASGRASAGRRLRGDAGELTLPVLVGAGVAIVVLVVLAIQVAYITGVIDDDERPRVLVLGDSISDRGQRSFREAVGGGFDLSIDGKASFRTDMMLPAAERWSTRPFEQVVINLGTNDVVQGADVDQSAAMIEQMIDLYPQAVCIHLVTVNESMPESSGPDVRGQAVAFNERLRAIAANDPRVRIVDWAAIVEEQMAQGIDPTLDGVHPTESTHPLLAEAETESLESCTVDTA
jgi:hypothetical protein